MSKKDIIITGANGQLGSELRFLTEDITNYSFHFYSRAELDITDKSVLEDIFNEIKPDYFINCAAYTAVDKAEDDIEKCFMINDYAVSLIADLCKEHDTALIHFSSDYVYHINKETPIIESDPTLPKGIYAQTKLAGEQAVIRSRCKYLIFRTSWVYSSYGNNFIKTVLRLAENRDEMSVVDNQIGTLTYARDLAEAVLEIIAQDLDTEWNQVYNYSNMGKSNWYEIAKKITEICNLSMKIKPIPSSDYPTPADRPLWSLLSKEKFDEAFGIAIPDWETSLVKCLDLIYNSDSTVDQ